MISKFSRSLEQFFLMVGQNNFDNKKNITNFFTFFQGPVASYLLLTSSVISFLGSLFYGENESAAEVAPPEMVAAEWRSFHQKPEVNLVNEIFCQKKNKERIAYHYCCNLFCCNVPYHGGPKIRTNIQEYLEAGLDICRSWVLLLHCKVIINT